MFEAVILACLISAPEVCRSYLLPGYEAATLARCQAALQDRVPVLPDQHNVQFVGTPSCARAGDALSVQEIAPGIFVHMGRIEEPDAVNKGDVSNLGFVIGTSGVAVIDTGTARWMGEAMWRAIRKRTDLPVTHVVLTHMHPDHVLGAAVFTEVGAQVVAHEALPRALSDRAANYLESLERLIGPAGFLGKQVVSVDTTVSDTMTIDIGERVLTITAWPLAHTGSDVTVLDPTTDTLFAGDLVFHLHTPALDGSLRGWRAALQKLAGLDLARVVPGHGGPILDWPEGGADVQRYLRVLAEDTRAAIRRGQRLGDAVDVIAESEAQNWALFSGYNPRNATVAYTELEWE